MLISQPHFLTELHSYFIYTKLRFLYTLPTFTNVRCYALYYMYLNTMLPRLGFHRQWLVSVYLCNV